MTVPQPAPDHRSAAANGGHDPWAAKPSAEAGASAGRPHWRREIGEALRVALPAALLTGLVLGLLWAWRAPRLPLVSDGESDGFPVNPEGQHAIAADGLFLLFGLAVGAVGGIAAFLLRRHGGAGAVLGLATGTLLGSVLAWRLGVWLGPDDGIAAQARAVGAGGVFDAPLELGARGVLLGMPFAALASHMLCVAAWGPRDPLPRPAEFPQWREPDPAPERQRDDG